jgi:hypothetical protein
MDLIAEFISILTVLILITFFKIEITKAHFMFLKLFVLLQGTKTLDLTYKNKKVRNCI